MNRFSRCTSGAAFIEFAAVFPIILLLTLGAIDFGFLTVKIMSVRKASYMGARLASLVDPVATGINAPPAGTMAGAECFDHATGQRTGNCTIPPATVCTGGLSAGTCCPVGSKPGQCTSNYPWNETSFTAIQEEMSKFLLVDTLDRRQLQVTYEPTIYGHAQRAGGAPMSVTVSVRCTTYPFYMLYPLMGWALPGQPADCKGIPGTGLPLSPFPTTVQSEDLSTDN